MKVPPTFREFYAQRYPGPWPCALGTPLEQLHQQLADTTADYIDMIVAGIVGEDLETDR